MRRAVAVVAVLAVLGFYFSGRLDHALYGVGLNFNECARNGFGATFCGSELDEYRTRVQGVQERLREATSR